LSIFEQVCPTLAYAHARGVIHRDLTGFINHFTTGHGDDSAERDVLFAGQTLDQNITGIKTAHPERDAPAACSI
jgi:serine/threonine protein kinase